MSKPNSPAKPYSEREKEYIKRVAGKVPAEVIAAAINRPVSGILQWAHKNGIKLRVPFGTLVKHWPDLADRMTAGKLKKEVADG